MSTVGNKVLSKMLDRLLAGLMSGPNMNCRPLKSRQRIDLTQLAKLADTTPEQTLLALLGHEKSCRAVAKVKPPKKSRSEHGEPSSGERAWLDQAMLLSKLRVIADDARTYENDTGVHALSVGFPLLSLPPGSFASAARNSTKRILAPIAFIPVTLLLKGGATPSVDLACRGEGADRVVPNSALLSWIEQQTGKPLAADMFEDEEGIDPWREITELVKHVAEAMRLQPPDLVFSARTEGAGNGAEIIVDPLPIAETIVVVPPGPQGLLARQDIDEPSPRSAMQEPETSTPEPETNTSEAKTPQPPKPSALHLVPAVVSEDDTQPAILLSAVLGLFPTAHQGLVRDTRAMLSDDAAQPGPIQSFLTSNIDFDAPATTTPLPGPQPATQRQISTERLAATADPCQARAVALARQAAGLVIHGPPGTGKSQTITNIISDHLARGQRVLLVCDKRTALDVVRDRLEHMGLGNFCGLVHDPQRDQRELYKSIHEQLANLPDAKLHPGAENDLQKVDAELQQLHDELTGYHKSLMEPANDGTLSFHELMGRWMSCRNDSTAKLDDASIAKVTIEQLESSRPALVELFDRAVKVDYFKNPWTRCAGITLADFLSRPMAEARTAMNRIQTAADTADSTADDRIPPFQHASSNRSLKYAKQPGPSATPSGSSEDLKDHLAVPIQQQAAARMDLAHPLAEAIPRALAAGLAPLASGDISVPRKLSEKLAAAANEITYFRTGPRNFDIPAPAGGLSPPQMRSDIDALSDYIGISSKWWALFAFKRRAQAARVLKRLSMPLTPTYAGKAKAFLLAIRARLEISVIFGERIPADDQRIEQWLVSAEQWLPLLEKIAADPALAGIGPMLAKAISAPAISESQLPFSDGPEGHVSDAIDSSPGPAAPAVDRAASPVERFLEGLRLSGPRADAIVGLEEQLIASTLIEKNWLADFSAALANGKLAHDTAAALADHLDQLEGVLRVGSERAALPASLGTIADQILSQVTTPDDAIATLQQKVLANEITRRLRENPGLQAIDGHRIDAGFDRFRQLDAIKKQLVGHVITHQWISRQKARLLAATGSRLNSTGADLRRRLTSRGERAMRLRQVIANGSRIEGGDPLFDLCPVWMASPETVAQIFPRSPMFDVVIFDEASQCRLEEALPVLTRGRRVVIAGDPNQLPPTRFFESGLVLSEDEDPETDQELFESHQGEVEDLLAAALNLSIQQCYLDVHYRSRNSDLIEFSNQNFYASRLQAIPGHPANRSRFSPLTLYRVDGTYSKRQNEAEAQRVVQIVRDLLRRATPPSIGIACLNLPQRDLITEKLDDLAADDADFAKRLAAARSRKGQGSFEGLFVKNLENVQGDERDDIIISTTYGPDPTGKFYRRFGPLGMTGGGRRLNVLVTRARCEVHLVTSIPAESYRSLPAVPQGQSATGAWLLFAYLKYAQELEAQYEIPQVDGPTSKVEIPGKADANPNLVVNVVPSRSPSIFAQSLATSLLVEPKIGSTVHWGNEGFCVDLALHHPVRPGDVTIGVLCDGCRYAGTDDALEWDIFRTGILTGQGWRLMRIWTPHFFRDPQGNVQSVVRAAESFLTTEKPADALPAVNTG